MNPTFDDVQRRKILALAREAILLYLETEKEVEPPAEEFFLQPLAAFVTLTLNEELRGCIGCTEASSSLGETIIRCAIGAAVRDPRFPALTHAEVDQIHVEVSILSPFRVVRSLEEIEVGVHGVYVTMGPFRGLFLPQVAVEQNWDRETFLSYACRKAGLHPHAWQTPAVKVEVFSAEVFGETHSHRDTENH